MWNVLQFTMNCIILYAVLCCKDDYKFKCILFQFSFLLKNSCLVKSMKTNGYFILVHLFSKIGESITQSFIKLTPCQLKKWAQMFILFLVFSSLCLCNLSQLGVVCTAGAAAPVRQVGGVCGRHAGWVEGVGWGRVGVEPQVLVIHLVDTGLFVCW